LFLKIIPPTPVFYPMAMEEQTAIPFWLHGEMAIPILIWVTLEVAAD
jgi:hypothetical protein